MKVLNFCVLIASLGLASCGDKKKSDVRSQPSNGIDSSEKTLPEAGIHSQESPPVAPQQNPPTDVTGPQAAFTQINWGEGQSPAEIQAHWSAHGGKPCNIYNHKEFSCASSYHKDDPSCRLFEDENPDQIHQQVCKDGKWVGSHWNWEHTVVDPVIEEGKAPIEGEPGKWADGKWEAGKWTGKWEAGKWIGGGYPCGEHPAGVDLGKLGKWVDGKWEAGKWTGGESPCGEHPVVVDPGHPGKWTDGKWEAGKWTGKWEAGKWDAGKWTGKWEAGKWDAGKWTGKWEAGKWDAGKWVDGKWEAGKWTGGEYPCGETPVVDPGHPGKGGENPDPTEPEYGKGA